MTHTQHKIYMRMRMSHDRCNRAHTQIYVNHYSFFFFFFLITFFQHLKVTNKAKVLSKNWYYAFYVCVCEDVVQAGRACWSWDKKKRKKSSKHGKYFFCLDEPGKVQAWSEKWWTRVSIGRMLELHSTVDKKV